jgi:hypothetical protein
MSRQVEETEFLENMERNFICTVEVAKNKMIWSSWKN